jgi:hypothetical protein
VAVEVTIIIIAAPIITEDINSKVDQTKEDNETTTIPTTAATLATKEVVIATTTLIATIEARVVEIEVADVVDLIAEAMVGLKVMNID